MSLLHRRALFDRLSVEHGSVQVSKEAIDLLERHLWAVVDNAAERTRTGGGSRISPALMRRAIDEVK